MAAGAVRLLAWVKRAYKQLLSWKLPNGVIIQFDSAKATLYFQSNVVSGTAQAGAAAAITLEADQVLATGALDGWIVNLDGGTGSGQKRIVIGSVVGTDVCAVHKDWDTEPDDTTTYELYHHRYKVLASTDAEVDYNISVDPVGEFFAAQMLHDLNSGNPIPLSTNKLPMSSTRETYGTPGIFFWDQSSIVFDKAPNAVRSYELEYVRIPPDMTLAADIPEIPEAWHDCIVLWALHRGLRRAQESGDAWAVKNDLKDMIATLVQQSEMVHDKQDGQLEIPDYGEYQ